MMKALSIITNFGCHFTCPYCIVKNNSIDVPITTIESLDRLKAAVELVRPYKISISGGGDPLYHYEFHTKYYDKLFNICQELNLPVEMHTSYKTSCFPYWKCSKVVYHCRSIDDLSKIKHYGNEVIRVVFVVDESFTQDKINEIVRYVKNSTIISELSFRQMVDKNYQPTDYCQDYLRQGHKKDWYYIEQCDYNTYFAEGELYDRYEDLKKK